MNGISALVRRDMRACSLSALHHVRTQESHLQAWKRALTRTQPCWVLRVLASRTVGNKRLLFRPPGEV